MGYFYMVEQLQSHMKRRDDMAKKLEPLVVALSELQRAYYTLSGYNALFEWGEGKWEMKEGVSGDREETLRQEATKILTDPRYEKVEGYMQAEKAGKYKLLTRVRLCLIHLKHHLNARKR